MSKRAKIWVVVGVLTIFIALGIVYTLGFFGERLKLVAKGEASPNFPYTPYNQQEIAMNSLYNKLAERQEEINKAETIQGPEETHAIFIEKLKAGDIDGAVECCFVKRDWEKMKRTFNVAKEEGRWDTVLLEISNIEQDLILDNMASYGYMTSYNDFEFKTGIIFQKNKDGVWLMEKF